MTGPLSSPGVFSKAFESAEQTLTASSRLTVAHGLGQAPAFALAKLRCKTADHGYAVGEEALPFQDSSSAERGFWISWDATNLYITFGTGLRISRNISPFGNTTDATLASWKFVIEAYV